MRVTDYIVYCKIINIWEKRKKRRKKQVEADVWEDCKIVDVIWGRYSKYLENFYKGIWHEYSCSSSLPSTPLSDISTDVTFLIFFVDFCPSSACSIFTFLVCVSLCFFSYLKLWFSTHLSFNSTLAIHCLEFIFHHFFHHMNNYIFYKLISWLSVFSNLDINSMKAEICFVLFSLLLLWL